MGAHLGPRPLGNTPYVPTPSFPRDPFFNAVSLLLHGDGTNGAQNNTFLDSSTNNFTVTRNGNTTQGTNTPFSQAAGAWSNYFDGNSFLFEAVSLAPLSLTGDFTVECWAYVQGSNDCILVGSNNVGGQNNQIFRLNSSGSNSVYIYLNGTAFTSTNNVYTLNTWNHYALTRSGSTVTLYVNGTSCGSMTYSGTIYPNEIGGLNGNQKMVIGYLSNVRIVNGTVVYTSNFTPSTIPPTAITNTALLTCQSNGLKDNSSNNFTVSRWVGNTSFPSVEPFSPFAPTSAYSTSVNGGSMYFDGTGDYLSLANNTALNLESGDFTIEAWFYTTSSSTTRPIVNRTNGNAGARTDIQFWIGILSGNLYISPYSGATDYSMTFSSVPLNQWNHVALVRTGNTFYSYLNGVRNATTQTITGNLNNGTWQTWIGGYRESSTFYYQLGYIGDVRILKGTALYTGSTYAVPTAPLTAITNTSLLLSGTNAGIFDNATKNNLETVGNAQVSTSVTKFGTGSMYLDGTGDYLTVPSNRGLVFEGDFTVEYWVYPTSPNPDGLNGSVLSLTIGSYQNGIFLRVPTAGSNDSYYVNNNQSTVALQSYFPVNTWTHLAIVRSGTSVKLYANGVNISAVDKTVSGVINSTAGITTIGYESASATTSYGYIDDLRITKGIARYTANFTPPTAAFLDQ